MRDGKSLCLVFKENPFAEFASGFCKIRMKFCFILFALKDSVRIQTFKRHFICELRDNILRFVELLESCLVK